MSQGQVIIEDEESSHAHLQDQQKSPSLKFGKKSPAQTEGYHQAANSALQYNLDLNEELLDRGGDDKEKFAEAASASDPHVNGLSGLAGYHKQEG